MAGFKFKLQSYLGVKEKIEDQKKLEYGKALKKLDEERQIKIELENKKAESVLVFRKSIQDGIKPLELRNFNYYIDFLKEQIKQQIILIEIAEKEAEKKRLELVEAMKQRKMLETLKENDKEAYNKQEMQKEQKIVDEIVSYQYNDRA